MPDADWVIVDRDNTWYTPRTRRYRVGVFLSDLHGKHNMGVGTPDGFLRLVNGARFDAVFLKYLEVHGCGYTDPQLFQKGLNCPHHFLPWSVDVEKHKPQEKDIDVAFMGSHQPRIYPLRSDMYARVLRAAEGYRVLRTFTPGGGTYGRRVDKLRVRAYVGDRYSDALNRSKVLLFGSSIYRYPVQKYFEGAASGCVLLCDEPASAHRLGFIDGETYMRVNISNWVGVMRRCLENYDEFKRVGENARRLAAERHSHEVRAKEFLRMLQ